MLRKFATNKTVNFSPFIVKIIFFSLHTFLKIDNFGQVNMSCEREDGMVGGMDEGILKTPVP